MPTMTAAARITAIATIKNATTVTLEWDDPSLAITDFDMFALGLPLDWKDNTVLLAGPCELEVGAEIPYTKVAPGAAERLEAALTPKARGKHIKFR